MSWTAPGADEDNGPAPPTAFAIGPPPPPTVHAFLTAILGYDAELCQVDPDQAASFANASQFLAVTTASVAALSTVVGGAPLPPARFRPNLVIDGVGGAWAEDAWIGTTLGIGDATFTCLAGCNRCRMVCIDQHTGARAAEPLATLHRLRRFGSRILFGVHLGLLSAAPALAVGDPLVIVSDPRDTLD